MEAKRVRGRKGRVKLAGGSGGLWILGCLLHLTLSCAHSTFED